MTKLTDEQILTAAIEKAVLNGYVTVIGRVFDFEIDKNDPNVVWLYELPHWAGSPSDTETTIREIVFDHSFAKAFWGEEEMCIFCQRHHPSFSDCDCGTGNTNPEWQIRLRQMVLEKNPLQFLAQFL